MTYNSDLRLKVSVTGLRTYTDLTVYCDDSKSDEENPFSSTYVNPTIIFEVLSKTTEAYDRGFKSENFRQIKSLKAYVLVSQTRPHLEIYERNGKKWESLEFKGMEDFLKIPPLGIDIPLARIYRG